jgi:DNA segregation ATPase FtsK/SpoIIIE, S-DNA-T family
MCTACSQSIAHDGVCGNPACPTRISQGVLTLGVPLPSPAPATFAPPRPTMRLADPAPRTLPPNLNGPLVRIPEGRGAAVTALLEERSRLAQTRAAVDEAEEHLFRAAQKAGGRTAAAGLLLFPAEDDPSVELQVLQTTVNVHVHRLTDLSGEISEIERQLDAVGRFKRKKRLALQVSLARLRSEMDITRQRIQRCDQQGQAAGAELRARLTSELGQRGEQISALDRSFGHESQLPWELNRWDTWRAKGASSVAEIRIGALRELLAGEELDVPLTIPFVGGGKSIVITSDTEEQRAQANALLQSLVLRTAAMFPQQAKYTLLDPAGNGLAFPMARSLAHLASDSGDVRRDLDEVNAEIQRIVRTYLDPSRPSFEDIPAEMRLAERYHFVFVANYPKGYDLRAAEALQTIARTGPRAGVYVIQHVARGNNRPTANDLSRFDIEDAWRLNLSEVGRPQADIFGSLVLDDAPSASLQEIIFDRLSVAPPRDQPIVWDDLNALPESEWWQETSTDLISAPIGRFGASESMHMWFGTNDWEERACVHGVLGAMPGAGKSTLFHNLITSLAIRYSPEELRFHLIDGKYGVEFQAYRNLPHASVVSLRTSPALSRSVLADLVEEMGRRNTMFARSGVADLPSYRRRGQPHGNLPRVLLVVDEYQQLFDGDRDGEASANLLRLSQQGRSVGIHMLLASQRFDTAGMLHRADIFGNMHLRMSMQLAQADSATLTDFGLKGRRLISATCDRVGRLVMNDRAGDDEANIAGKAALLDARRRDEIIAMLASKAALLSRGSFQARTVVFNGPAQPELLNNPHVQGLLLPGVWLDNHRMEALARAEQPAGGFGVHDWLAAERPVALFLGQEFNVRGHANVVLRRRRTEHLAVVGEHHETRIAVVAAAMMSAALVEHPTNLQVWTNDRSVDRASWSDVLAATTGHLASLGVDARIGRRTEECTSLLNAAMVELDRREKLSEDEQSEAPTLMVVLNEPDRVPALQRTSDDYGSLESDLGRTLRALLSRGSAVGIHVIVSIASLGLLRSVLSDKALQDDVRHRVVMQMPEDDSFVLIRSSAASKLQADGDRPLAALAFDTHRQEAVRFKPYSIAATNTAFADSTEHGDFMTQIASITQRLASRFV